MHLFLLLSFPLCLAIWILRSEGRRAPCVFNAFLGILLAAVFCAYKYFFAPYYFLTPDSFFRNFIHVFFEQILLPLGVLTAAFLFVFKKDKISDRVEGLFPFYAVFYAVFLPFRILQDNLPNSAFGLFAKPILFILTLLVLSECEKSLFVPSQRAMLDKLDAFSVWSSFVLALIFPAGFEALWVLGMNAFVTILLLGLYSAGTVLFLKKRLSQK